MGNQDLPDIYALTLRPAALRLGHIYQANPLAHVITITSMISDHSMISDLSPYKFL